MPRGKQGMSYCLQWKDPSDHSKGTIWTFMPIDIKEFAGVPHLEEEMGCMMTGHRPQLCMRGTKWKATWDEETVHTIRSSPQATRPLMASIVRRWSNFPVELQREGGKPFDIKTLQARKNACVYLVELLTFEKTASGKNTTKSAKQYQYQKGSSSLDHANLSPPTLTHRQEMHFEQRLSSTKYSNAIESPIRKFSS